MRAEYELLEEQFTDPESGVYTAYGVVVKIDGQIFCSISDVFLDLAFAEQMISMCNKQNLSPVHLDDLIEDILAR